MIQERPDMKGLLGIAEGTDFAEVSRRGLEWLRGLAPYDLATLFELEGNELVARTAQGRLAREAVSGHRLDLREFPSIREAIEGRRARIFTEHDHAHGEGDPYDGVLDLPHGHACMVVPLCAGDETVGLVTVDREECQPYSEETRGLVELYGQIFAIALERSQRLGRLADLRERERSAEQSRERVSDPARVLEESRSPRVQELARRARAVAETDTPVLILGETGTGKEQLARALHGWSARADQPFVALNCAAVSKDLVESELFGHVKGAFTGASGARQGCFQTARGGTLLLDEIGELAPDLQAKLLRVLQERRLTPVGSDKEIEVDVRVIAATHVDIEEAVADGRFREDLYYRLNVFPLELPPLRERMDDFEMIAGTLLRDVAARMGRPEPSVAPEALEKLRGPGWSGTLRELSNVFERALILDRDGRLDPDDIDLPAVPGATAGPASDRLPRADGAFPTLAEIERAHIQDALERSGGQIYGKKGAAALLGIRPTTLQSRIKKYGSEAPAA
ncbi:MAG: sigma 54-interacting transcriptional regulator [Myxococcota bacterium]